MSYDGAVQALKNVSLEVGEGSVVAVLGSNGAGKTSLLRAISRALGEYGGAVTGGTIRYEGATSRDGRLGRGPAAASCRCPRGGGCSAT